jgi:hypothetical protein
MGAELAGAADAIYQGYATSQPSYMTTETQMHHFDAGLNLRGSDGSMLTDHELAHMSRSPILAPES